MRNYESSFRNSGPYTSPGTPEYGLNTLHDTPKTWSSERVSGGAISGRRHTAALMPFSSGRAPPSKWDDAERWIASPVLGQGGLLRSPVAQAHHHHHHHRRPKSKSGPLGGASEPGPTRRFAVANSPLTTGVLVPDRFLAIGGGPNVKSGLDIEGSLATSLDDKLDGTNEEEARVSRRDMATQMSPESSNDSSIRATLSFSNLPFPIVNKNPSAKDEIRDVRVDKGTATITKHSKKKGHKKKEKEKGSANVEESNSWNMVEVSKNISKSQREEAKITAWENLQKAKAEAAIRKLEMKLEKKRSASMDKITNKLKAAHTRAQAMRDLLSDQPPTTSDRGFCIYVKVCSSCTCFLCSKR